MKSSFKCFSIFTLTILSYNAAHGSMTIQQFRQLRFCASSPLNQQKPFASAITRRQSSKDLTFHFLFPSLFSRIFIFIFSFNYFLCFLSFNFVLPALYFLFQPSYNVNFFCVLSFKTHSFCSESLYPF